MRTNFNEEIDDFENCEEKLTDLIEEDVDDDSDCDSYNRWYSRTEIFFKKIYAEIRNWNEFVSTLADKKRLFLWAKFEKNSSNETIYTIKACSIIDPYFFEANEYDKYNFDEPIEIINFSDDGIKDHRLKIQTNIDNIVYCIWRQRLPTDNQDECHLVCYSSEDLGKTWVRSDRFSRIIKITDLYELTCGDEGDEEIKLDITALWWYYG
ncbi:MAG: hypothetical protein HZB76_03385 [Chlamydiae bacterium]|nr:hypothetical protein [Chlamydiota bacterium]